MDEVSDSSKSNLMDWVSENSTGLDIQILHTDFFNGIYLQLSMLDFEDDFDDEDMILMM